MPTQGYIMYNIIVWVTVQGHVLDTGNPIVQYCIITLIYYIGLFSQSVIPHYTCQYLTGGGKQWLMQTVYSSAKG